MMDKPPQNNKEHRDEDNLTPKQRAIWESKKSEYESDSVNQELREAGPQIR